jgi:FkbM family methyltransferase
MYPGYEASDIDLVRTFVVGPASVDGDRYTDGFGVQTLHACVPFQQPAALHLGRLALPFPDDGFHAEAIEYTAMADAMRRARGRKSFCAVEIGAGWGPWVVACGVIARRNGVKDIHLVGVEASTERFELMRRHVQTNGFPVPDAGGEDAAQDGFSVRLFRGAIWINDGSIWFPESDVADMGPAVSEEDAGTDYRGTRARHTQVACRRMETLMAGRERVDFMHIDIQGAEFDVINTSIDWIHSHVAALMIATHSRVIEGRLIELLLARGWKLHREKPCQVHWSRECELPGRTWADGSQYWINPALF